MPSTPPGSPRHLFAASPGRSALIGLVTLVAVLLTCRVKVRSLEWSFDYPLMSLGDPTHSLFLYGEHERRELQSGMIPRWLLVTGECSACDEASLSKRWNELLDEHQRYRDEGYRRHGGARWVREAQAARDISLAGWGNAERVALLRSLSTADLPDYLVERAQDITGGNTEVERARSKRIGRDYWVSFGIHLAFVLFALGSGIAWRLGYRYPRRPARSRLAAPDLGRGLVVFLWADGFVSVLTRMSTHRAALISCVVFAVVHGYGWFGFASVALTGYLWARLAARTGSLVPGAFAHGIFNLVVSFAALSWRI